MPQDVTVSRSAPAHRTALSHAYARLDEVCPWLRVTELAEDERLPEGPGWVTVAELAAGGAALDTYLAWDAAQIRRDYGQQGRPDVIAGFGLHRYAWYGCLLLTVPWFLDRRVPRLPVSEVTFHREQGHLALRTGSFACLPDDPAAHQPGARVVADEEALRTELLAALTEHLTPLLDRFGPLMRRRGRSLWGTATDEITDGLWTLGRMLGEEQRAREELTLLLPGGTLPYAGSAAFRELPAAPGRAPELTRDRITCCLFYTLRPEEICQTCPRICDAERLARRTRSAALAG
ncbi:(2Fe-2S)-binding protein [Streptomyces sp. NA04227]|uniref:(2Fe-2S)-binding protein n=1 Tax=Streptomyces sp. NA04227 TaxID=2742136 RepID=UPI001592156C|nr:(2Fe-2S)-binding protein [Streptomyces sp. NA04227]QKW10022.1 (2Fe-2S)-binding protein [Streptomyces sp. NA04227]